LVIVFKGKYYTSSYLKGGTKSRGRSGSFDGSINCEAKIGDGRDIKRSFIFNVCKGD
jgi:hypothetical protein